MWTCPACGLVIAKFDQNWQCANGHHYDEAKEGYLNLLLANQKRSKDPGDSKQMINARRAFLELDHYLPMAQKLVGHISQNSNSEAINVFDAGCGEGYYLQKIRHLLTTMGKKVITGGIDISKSAIQKAAKKHSENRFAVASTYKLPVVNDYFDAVVQVFAPSSSEEILRILLPGGIWVQVNPGLQHLKEVKQVIYDHAEEHQLHHDIADGFTLLSDEILRYEFSLNDPQSRLDLLMMTPYYWSAKPQDQEKLQQEMGQLSADFHIRVLQKA